MSEIMKKMTAPAPARRYFLVRAICFLVLVAGLTLFAIVGDVTKDGALFLYGMIAFFALIAIYDYYRFRKAARADAVVAPGQGTPSQKHAYFRRFFWMALIGFPIVCWFTAYDLYRLHAGTVRSVSVYEPAATVYKLLGFWPAMICWPIIGMACLFAIYIAMKKAERSIKDDQPKS